MTERIDGSLVLAHGRCRKKSHLPCFVCMFVVNDLFFFFFNFLFIVTLLLKDFRVQNKEAVIDDFLRLGFRFCFCIHLQFKKTTADPEDSLGGTTIFFLVLTFYFCSPPTDPQLQESHRRSRKWPWWHLHLLGSHFLSLFTTDITVMVDWA